MPFLPESHPFLIRSIPSLAERLEPITLGPEHDIPTQRRFLDQAKALIGTEGADLQARFPDVDLTRFDLAGDLTDEELMPFGRSLFQQDIATQYPGRDLQTDPLTLTFDPQKTFATGGQVNVSDFENLPFDEFSLSALGGPGRIDPKSRKFIRKSMDELGLQAKDVRQGTIIGFNTAGKPIVAGGLEYQKSLPGSRKPTFTIDQFESAIGQPISSFTTEDDQGQLKANEDLLFTGSGFIDPSKASGALVEPTQKQIDTLVGSLRGPARP